MSYTINYEGDDTGALNAYLAKVAHASAAAKEPYVVRIALPPSTGDPGGVGDYALLNWQPARTLGESAALVVRPYSEEHGGAEPGSRTREIPTDDIAEITFY